jgi:hypothetical protein
MKAVVGRFARPSARSVLALCVLGIIVSGSAVLQRIAEGLAEHGLSQAKMPSIERRLARITREAAHRGERGLGAVSRASLAILAGQAALPGAGLYPLWRSGVHRLRRSAGTEPRVEAFMASDAIARGMGRRAVGKAPASCSHNCSRSWPGAIARSSPIAGEVPCRWSRCARRSTGITCCALTRLIRADEASWKLPGLGSLQRGGSYKWTAVGRDACDSSRSRRWRHI